VGLKPIPAKKPDNRKQKIKLIALMLSSQKKSIFVDMTLFLNYNTLIVCYSVIKELEVGDNEYNKYYMKYSSIIVNFLCSKTGNLADAEELSQDVFVRFYETFWDKDVVEETAGGLLHHIASRVFNSWYAKRMRREEIASTKSMVNKDTNANIDIEDDASNPETKLLNKLTDIEVDLIVNKLSPKNREMFGLRYYSKKSYKEIGELLGIIPATARQRYKRAVQKLLEIIDYIEEHGRY